MQSKGFLFFLGSVALLGTLATLYLPHWSGSLYVLVVVGYFFRGGKGWPWAAGLLMGLLWVGLALGWDLPNQGMLAGRVAALLSTSRSILWLITGVIGFLLGLVGVALGQALAHWLPQTPPRLRRHGK